MSNFVWPDLGLNCWDAHQQMKLAGKELKAKLVCERCLTKYWILFYQRYVAATLNAILLRLFFKYTKYTLQRRKIYEI